MVDHPRRLEELFSLLEDKDVMVRERAAATLARLSESHSDRLLRVTERLKIGLTDDSAYVRWHIVYALSQVGSRHPSRASSIPDVFKGRLADDNRVVRSMALSALADLAAREPEAVAQAFAADAHAMPPAVARILRRTGRKPKAPALPSS